MSARAVIRLELDGVEHELPAHFEVCHRCEGKGSHVNPAIDGNGLTAEDFEEQGEEFREDYMAGVYDVACERCRGDRVVPVLDRKRCDQKLLAAYDEREREEREYQACCAAERRAGA